MLGGLSITKSLRTYEGAWAAARKYVNIVELPAGTTNPAGQLVSGGFDVASDGVPFIKVVRSGNTLEDAKTVIHELIHYFDWNRAGRPVGEALTEFKNTNWVLEYGGDLVKPFDQVAGIILDLAKM